MSEDRQHDTEAVAAQWVSRLSGDPLRPRERCDLDRWLAAHPDHRAAFDFAQATWRELGALRASPGALANDFVPPPEASESATVFLPGRRRPLRRLGALAACLLIAVALGAFWIGDPVTMIAADYRTAPAETLSVELPDGSLVDLGPASALALRYSDEERRIELLSGALYVTAAPMAGAETRPFLVQAADGTSKALGTVFLVDRLADAVEVAVVRHRVEVDATAGSGDAEAVVLEPGQSVRYDPANGLGRVRSAAVETLTAWRRGRLIFDRVPLATVVAALNRYRRGGIVIANPALAERTVSGLFETDKLDDALDAIATELGATQLPVPPFVTVLF